MDIDFSRQTNNVIPVVITHNHSGGNSNILYAINFTGIIYFCSCSRVWEVKKQISSDIKTLKNLLFPPLTLVE